MRIPDPDTGRPLPDPDLPEEKPYETDLPGRRSAPEEPLPSPRRSDPSEPAVPFTPMGDATTSF